MQSMSFILAAAATMLGGRMERRLGVMQACGVVAGILLLLTFMLIAVLARFMNVRIIPVGPRAPQAGDRRETRWEPTILGNPGGTTRKINLFEAGKHTRYSEIRRRNRLNTGLTGAELHLS